MADLAALEQRALTALKACGDAPALRPWHSHYLGDKGEVPAVFRKMGDIPPAERKAFGQQANQVKDRLTQAYKTALAEKHEAELQRSLAEESVDVTLPGRPAPRGRLHV